MTTRKAIFLTIFYLIASSSSQTLEKLCNPKGDYLKLYNTNEILHFNAEKAFISGLLMGEGSFGVVKMNVLDDITNTQVALKKVKNSPSLLKEMKIMLKLSNKGISPNFYGCQYGRELVFKDKKKPILGKEMATMVYIVQELLYKDLESQTSLSYLKSLDLDQKLTLYLNIIYGISKLNELGYNHSDIKPANLMLNSNKDKIYLIDFGVAQELNQALRIAGSPLYMSKNKWKGVKNLAKDDLYALALTIAVIESSSDEIFMKKRKSISDPLKYEYISLNKGCFLGKPDRECTETIFNNVKRVLESKNFGKYHKGIATYKFNKSDAFNWNLTTLLLNIIEFDNYSLDILETKAVMENLIENAKALKLLNEEQSKKLQPMTRGNDFYEDIKDLIHEQKESKAEEKLQNFGVVHERMKSEPPQILQTALINPIADLRSKIKIEVKKNDYQGVKPEKIIPEKKVQNPRKEKTPVVIRDQIIQDLLKPQLAQQKRKELGPSENLIQNKKIPEQEANLAKEVAKETPKIKKDAGKIIDLPQEKKKTPYYGKKQGYLANFEKDLQKKKQNIHLKLEDFEQNKIKKKEVYNPKKAFEKKFERYEKKQRNEILNNKKLPKEELSLKKKAFEDEIEKYEKGYLQDSQLTKENPDLNESILPNMEPDEEADLIKSLEDLESEMDIDENKRGFDDKKLIEKKKEKIKMLAANQPTHKFLEKAEKPGQKAIEDDDVIVGNFKILNSNKKSNKEGTKMNQKGELVEFEAKILQNIKEADLASQKVKNFVELNKIGVNPFVHVNLDKDYAPILMPKDINKENVRQDNQGIQNAYKIDRADQGRDRNPKTNGPIQIIENKWADFKKKEVSSPPIGGKYKKRIVRI